MDYGKTINLPKTDFPMRARLPEREPDWQKFWDEKDVYQQLRNKCQGRPKFILHDGPPYANGNIHLGTAMNKILKDFIIRFASMKGYDAPFVPGWDTHGLPIELKALKEQNADRHDIAPVELRDHCRNYALKFIDIMTDQFRRLGVMADWKNPYVTLHPEYEARQVEVFGVMAEKGYIYKGLKSVYWCAECETALAEAEIEYDEKVSHSVHVAFEVKESRGKLPPGARAVIWTTTPWTIPANVAIAAHPDVEYILARFSRGEFLVAADRAGELGGLFGDETYEVTGCWRGSELDGLVCRHPLFDRDAPLVFGDFVTTDEGTGLVHIAPGHGQEDFEVGRLYRLPVIMPIDDRGRFTAEGGPFAGARYDEANPRIVEALRNTGALLHQGKIRHQYAHCWRCKQPVIYRATEQWFASVEGFRQQALAAVDSVRWFPAWGRNRIYNMVEGRTDWCISRQRVWGVPIPAFYCCDCSHVLLNSETVKAVADLFRKEGSNAWYRLEASQILPAGTSCPKCNGVKFRQETDIMDVWFDSGSSHVAVLEERPELKWPADMYLEGSDQHRGWFQSSLLTSVAMYGRAPYRSVLTHGFVVDGEGRKMSKSLGNVVVPEDVIKDYGADILRLWVASADYAGDVRVSPDILKQLAEVYRKIRNTLRFLLGNLEGFNPDGDLLPPDELKEIDRWALHRTNRMLERAGTAYEDYHFHLVYHAVHNYCVNEMSSFYLDVLKDRLYTFSPKSKERRSAQTALFLIAEALVRVIAPILPHTAEEVWQYLPHRAGDPESVHLADWPSPMTVRWDDDLEDGWGKLNQVREAVARHLEVARNERLIPGTAQAEIWLDVDSAIRERLLSLGEPLRDLLLVSRVHLDGSSPDGMKEVAAGIRIAVGKTGFPKCERCWRYDESVGSSSEHPQLCLRCAEVVTMEFH